MKNVVLFLVVAAVVAGGYFTMQGGLSRPQFHIVSGSENKALEPLLAEFGKQHKVEIAMKYKGSLDIMLELQSGVVKVTDDGSVTADAVWPANSLWISLGDKEKVVKHDRSIMTSPVVFGIRQSKARELGFVGRKVFVADILSAVERGDLTFMMTSATQSNSGASAFFGFLNALLDNPDAIAKQDLHGDEVKLGMRKLLGAVHRSSGSSGWLKDLFLSTNKYNAMVNYEALIIEANQELVRRGEEPLQVIYPVDGIVLADSPLGFVKTAGAEKEQVFLELQKFLTSDSTQTRISQLGRRTGFGGIMGTVNKQVFNPAWGVDSEKVLSPFRLPSADVIWEALNLYQTEFRKPSFTIYCLDYSGSMEGTGEAQLRQAMRLLLDQQQARRYMLQAASNDVTVVIPFSRAPWASYKVEGNAPAQLSKLMDKINSLSPKGATDIYTPVINGLAMLQKEVDLSQYQPAIILLTDGESNSGATFNAMASSWNTAGLDIPVFAIQFGDASETQLKEITNYTRARVFDGRKDLVSAFRKVKGYN